MFLMDVLRHTGAARMAEFVGNTPGNVAMDQAQLRSAYYTPAEADGADRTRPPRTPAPRAAAARRRRRVPRRASTRPSTTCARPSPAPTCPAEYAALQKTPTDWTRADIVYIASLVGGIFGKGGGHEIANAQWWQALKARFGKKKALPDLRRPPGEERPRGADHVEQGGAVRRRSASTRTCPASRCPTAAAPTRPRGPAPCCAARPAPAPARCKPRLDLPDGVHVDLSQLGAHGMSNALLVTGKESTTGKPLAVMGPQTGYYAPQLLVEQVLNGPGIQARGVAFAGTNLFVQLGRGVDYAWSATSAGSDNIDTVVEKLCNTDGSKATRAARPATWSARRACRCSPTCTSETTTPEPHRARPPRRPTSSRCCAPGTASSRSAPPWAASRSRSVLQRSTYGHEVDSVLGFGEFNDPGFVHDAKSFQQAASDIDYTFNWFYADAKDISYYSSGLLPKRSTKVEPDLPHWAGKKYDWKGWLSFKRHAAGDEPQARLPGQLEQQAGARTSRPPTTTGATAPVYRSLALEKRLQAKIGARRRSTCPDMVGVMSGGATADSRAAYTLPWLLKVIGNDQRTTAGPHAAEAVAQGRRPARRPRPQRRLRVPGRDRAVRLLVGGRPQSVAYDVLAGRLGDAGPPAAAGPRRPPAARARARRSTGSRGTATCPRTSARSSARRSTAAYSTGYCGKGSLQACRSDPARLAGRRGGSGAQGAGQVIGRPAHLRQGRGRHPLHHRRCGRRPAHRLAEPADLPAGDLVPRPSVAPDRATTQAAGRSWRVPVWSTR